MSDGRECWHCGQALAQRSERVHVAGAQRNFCCKSCAAAAAWIEQLGLSDYYRLRSSPATRPETISAQSAQAWERPEVARHVVRDLGSGQRETTMFIEGLRCSGCTWLIERVLGGLQGVTAVQVNASACRARIVWDSSRAGLSGIIDRLAHAGYRGVPINAAAIDDARRRESRDAIKRLGVAGLGAMQAMMFASALYLGAGQDDAATRDLFRWLALLVATPVVFYSARPFFRGAWRSLRARHLGIDIPVAVAIALIYAASIIQALRGGSEVYFDSVSMFVFFLLVGRYLEMRARHRSGDLVDALARLTPPLAQRLRDDGSIEHVGTVELRPGDRLHVAEGELIPADGVLQSAACRVDENLLSGESTPRLRRQGDTLLAGSVLIDGPARLRVERTGDTTVLGGIMRLVERAQAERPQLARAGERAAARFVLRVVLLAIATAGGWLIIDPSRAFEATVAVLVVSCPCAFALAVPAAITRALAVMAQGRVLVVRPDAVEKLAQATHAVFDKTGT
ncbi:MAG TPA: heavy metal translocating P-type ATPase metal-binding domain-containing protein, partial [Rudaea sp.]|nr:heavy metal translocating P-type ATPase metal-binding domain-containing protein [Rudaea sp.]